MNFNKLTTGKVYFDYDDIIKQVENWIKNKNPQLVGCEDSHVRARIIQRVIALTTVEYAQQSTKVGKNCSQSSSNTLSKFINSKGLRICIETGLVKISTKLWMKNILIFIALWTKMLFLLIVSIFLKSPKISSSAAILFEAGGSLEKNDSEFIRFCRHGDIEPLSSSEKIIVKVEKFPKKLTDPSIVYAANPLSYLINNILSIDMKYSLLKRHMIAPYYYFQSLHKYPVTILLSRETSIIPVVRLLDERKIISSIIITTSSFSIQYLWMKGLINQQFKLHMLWYSQNFIPKMYLNDDKRPNLPAARHMRIDVHWVWTEGFKDYLREIGQKSEIYSVGPILWYLPEKVTGFDDDSIKIAIFDITPIQDNSGAFGAVKNYYTVNTMKKFVIDILNVCNKIKAVSGKRILILLKHKRKPVSGRHDSTYLDFLHYLENSNPDFQLIDVQTNLYGLLDKCNLCISVPYTSTAYVAAFVSKISIFYDPFAELIPKYESNQFVKFVAGPIELEKIVCSYLVMASK